MESVTIFIEIFSRLWKEKNHGELNRLLSDAPTKYFRDPPFDRKDLILKQLMDSNDGLLKFIKIEVNQQNYSTELSSCLRQGIEVIGFLIDEYYNAFEPYANTTIELCAYILKVNSTYHMKRSAMKVFIKILEKYPDTNLNLDVIVETFMKKIHLYTKKHQPLLLKIICCIAKYRSDNQQIINSEKRIKMLLMNLLDLGCQEVKKNGYATFQLAIESSTDLFYSFPIDNVESTKLYKIIKQVGDFTKTPDKSQFLLIESLIIFMIQMMPSFQEFIKIDYKYWNIFFHKLIDKKIHTNLVIQALKIYYQVMSNILSGVVIDENLLYDLKTSFEEKLKNEYTDDTHQRVDIIGYSQLAETIKNRFGNIEVEMMFNLVSKRASLLFGNKEITVQQFENIAVYQEALSKIFIHMSTVTINQIKKLTKLTSLIIKRFAELPELLRIYSIDSLKRTIINVFKLKPFIFKEFMDVIIYDGIVWSCSHTLYIDAELSSDLFNSTKKPISYKNYIQLWKSLMDNFHDNNEVYNRQYVVDKIIDTFIILSTKLNLNIKNKNDDIYFDPALTDVADNETDYRIFLNMIDLYDEILGFITPTLWTNKMPEFIYKIITASYKSPLVSGFYKIVNRIIQSSLIFDDFYNDDIELFNAVLEYLLNAINKIDKYPIEIQVVVIKLILKSPMIFVPHFIERVDKIFKISLKIGLDDFDLANDTLDTLDKYMSTKDNLNYHNIIKKIIPSLNLYLKSQESIEINQDKLTSIYKKMKKNIDDFELLQNRILLLFGKIDNSLMIEFLHNETQHTNASWDDKNLLEYSMTFPDGSLDVYLDTLLPRIIDLSLNSSDRRTKVVASEVLYSITAIILGKTVHFLASNPDRYSSFYKLLCPSLLILGCDSDDVVKQLFNPLTFQMTHWLSNRLMRNSPASYHLIDCLFDGLCDETNSLTRDFSGILLGEFAKWTIKQSSDRYILDKSNFINTIVRNIKNFSLHSWNHRRIAAAIGFNHMYKILRENDKVIDVYWLEFLYCFIKSIDDCFEKCIINVLGHIERVIIEKSNIFLTTNNYRIIPDEFNGGTLFDAMNWLLIQCGKFKKTTVQYIMNIIENLSSKIEYLISPKNVIKQFIDTNGFQEFENIILGNLDDFTANFTEKYLNNLSNTLNLCNWLLQNNFIEANLLFSSSNPRNLFIFKCIKNFLSSVDKMSVLECETFIIILDFISIIIELNIENKNEAMKTIFQAKLFSFATKCTLVPHTVGFDMKNILLTEQLMSKLNKLFVIGKKQFNDEKMIMMIDQIDGEINKNFNWCNAFSFSDIVTTYENPIDTRVINGLILLQKCNCLEDLDIGHRIISHKKNKLNEIFEILKYQNHDQDKCMEIEEQNKQYINYCLELFLHNEITFVAVKKFILNKTKLLRYDNIIITHGEYFFNTFHDILIRCSLVNIDETIKSLVDIIYTEADTVMFYVEAMTIFLEKQKLKYQKEIKKFANIIIYNFEIFLKMINSTTRANSFNNIYKIIIQFLDKPSEVRYKYPDFYTWILTELSENSNLSEKTRIINDFVVCLTTEDGDDDPRLLLILKMLKNHCKTKTQIETSNNPLELIKITECFETLMKMLPVTKSIVIFETAIHFSLSMDKYSLNNTMLNYLKCYFNIISSNSALKSLNLVYRIFMNHHASTERLNMLKNFIIPSFKACSSTTIEKFFEQNIYELFKTINESDSDNPIDFEKLIVSKIGTYNILEYLFFKVEEKNINKTDSVISLNAFADQSNTKLLVEQIFKTTLNVRKFNNNNTVINKEFIRLLHCAAYNCSIIITSKSTDNKYYLSLFAENPKKDQFIWKKIIDCDKKYALSQTFKEYPKKRKEVLNLKANLKKKKNYNIDNNSCIKNYNLTSSTLAEDIYEYDLSEAIVIKNSSDDGLLLSLEEDDLNNHECMYQICGILKHMMDNELVLVKTKPNWLDCFVGSMLSEHYNVRLFLLKIILNNQNIFKTVANRIIEPIMDIIIKMLNDGNLNYVITDSILVLVDWADIVIPKNNTGIEKANVLFSLFADKVEAGTTTEYIVRNNFNIMDLLVKAWSSILDVPHTLDKKILEKPTRGIRIILIILSQNMSAKIIKRQDIMDFLITYLEKNWRYNEEDVLHSCESIGLFLKASESIDNFNNYKTTIIEKLNTAFSAIREPTRLVKCINAVCNAYPIISKNFQEFVLRNHLKLASIHKAKSMEVFYHMIPSMTDQEIIQEMRHLKFNNLLNDKVFHCEIICLKIIERLMTILDAENYIPLAKLASVYSQHNDQEYRQIVYQIFINIYKKYSNDISLDCHKKILITMSKEILLPGLLEKSENLKEILIKFWTEEYNFSDNCPDRILDIFDIYSPKIENDFLTFFGIIFLYLSKKSPDYDKKLFAPLDANCNQQNYNIVVSWRRKNLTHKIPLFTNSYASQYTQRTTLSTMDNFIATNDGFMLRATQTPNFVDTFSNDAIPETSSNTILPDEHIFKIPKSPSNNITSKRFTKNNELQISRHKYVPDNYARKEKIHRQAMKQRTDVKLNRSYKYGDFPDTEITHESILNPIQELIKKDKLLCKNFIVSMINSVINRLASSRQPEIRDKYQKFIENISKKLSIILTNHRGNDLIITAIFEILIQNENIKFDTNLIAHVAMSAGLDSLGALLLEKKLLKEPDDEPPLKRIKVVESCVSEDLNKIDQWIQLAELYESVDDVDIFLSIFQNHVAGVELHNAAKLQAACKWDQALNAYELAHASETKAIKRHCQQEIYECLARLSDWDILTKRIKEDFGNNKELKDFLDLIKEPDQSWVVPWYFQSHMYLYQDTQNDDNSFFDQVNDLKKNSNYKDIIHDLFSHELVFFWTLDRHEETKDQIRLASKKIREQWIQLSNFSFQLKKKQVMKLRGLANVDMITKVNKNLLNVEEILLRYWSHTHPTQHDDLLYWDIHINHRSNFGRLLKHELQQKNDNSQEHNLADALDESIIKQLLSMIDAGLKQKNIKLVNKYLENAEYYEKTKEFKNEFILKRAEGALLEATCGQHKIEGYVKSWKRCQRILNTFGNSLKYNIKISTLQLLSDISLSLKEFSVKNQQDCNKIHQKIGEIDDYNNFSLEKLKEACNVAENDDVDDNITANCHLKILKYCYMKLIDGEFNIELLKNFVKSTLKSMAYGSQEAVQYFPCLLKSKYLNDQEIIDIFEEGCKNVSSWRFLPWQPQLLFHLSSNLEKIISPIIERLVKDYPNALVYSFHVLYDTNPDLEDSLPFLRIKKLLGCQKVEKFIEAMNYLVRPELYLEYHLKNLLDNLNLGKYTVVERLKKKVYQNDNMHGDLYKACINKYRDDIELIKEMEYDNIKNHVYKLMADLKKSLLTKKNSEYLEDYSPWLSNFTCSELEIPGQYTGYKKPIPKYHAKITKIESKINVMASLRRPIKITIVGNDAKNYNFLVKFGEDLGLDEIIEQVFGTMNDILKSNPVCSQRHLGISTYKVIPFSGSLGLIQWIDGTKTLQDYINFSLDNSEKNELEIILGEYEEWIHQASPDSSNIVKQYKEALFKYNAKDTIDKMKSFINRTNWNIMQRTFVKINSTLEGFMFSKKNFIITYAVMCAAHWILGIGDRHLKNLLISIDSGRCIGIDFNSAFGGGIDQSIPELVPFRLTNQITSLMKPFNEHDLFGMTMIHVIKALRDGKGPIIASIDGVAHHKLSKIDSTQTHVKIDSDNWFPDKKINLVLKKLNGEKPSMIICEELEIKHRDKYWNRYKTIVDGSECDSVRLKMSDETLLSPEKQVKCLLELATDLNILGRAYGPWMPWL